MAKTGKEQVEEIRQRKNEYTRMRAALIEIVEAADTTNADRIAAINTVIRIDEGIPQVQLW